MIYMKWKTVENQCWRGEGTTSSFIHAIDFHSFPCFSTSNFAQAMNLKHKYDTKHILNYDNNKSNHWKSALENAPNKTQNNANFSPRAVPVKTKSIKLINFNKEFSQKSWEKKKKENRDAPKVLKMQQQIIEKLPKG